MGKCLSVERNAIIEFDTVTTDNLAIQQMILLIVTDELCSLKIEQKAM